MIKTTKKIFTEKPSAKDLPENYKFLEFSDIKITTDDESEKVIFRFTEKAFNLEDAERQVTLDGLPQFNDDGSPIMETYQKQIDKTFAQKHEEFTYNEFFAIRNQIRAQLPSGLSPSQEYKAINEQGLVGLIVQKGYYRNQFVAADFIIS
jgi:hypothetical protein